MKYVASEYERDFSLRACCTRTAAKNHTHFLWSQPRQKYIANDVMVFTSRPVVNIYFRDN